MLHVRSGNEYSSPHRNNITYTHTHTYPKERHTNLTKKNQLYNLSSASHSPYPAMASSRFLDYSANSTVEKSLSTRPFSSASLVSLLHVPWLGPRWLFRLLLRRMFDLFSFFLSSEIFLYERRRGFKWSLLSLPLSVSLLTNKLAFHVELRSQRTFHTWFLSWPDTLLAESTLSLLRGIWAGMDPSLPLLREGISCSCSRCCCYRKFILLRR